MVIREQVNFPQFSITFNSDFSEYKYVLKTCLTKNILFSKPHRCLTKKIYLACKFVWWMRLAFYFQLFCIRLRLRIVKLYSFSITKVLYKWNSFFISTIVTYYFNIFMVGHHSTCITKRNKVHYKYNLLYNITNDYIYNTK